MIGFKIAWTSRYMQNRLADKRLYIFFLLFLLVCFSESRSQVINSKPHPSFDTLPPLTNPVKIIQDTEKITDPKTFDTLKWVRKKIIVEKDMKEVTHNLFQPHRPYLEDTADVKFTKKHYSFVPAFGYTLQTGFAAIFSANAAYYTDNKPDSKLSTILTSITYSQYQQTIVPLQINIWTKGNKYNWITDFRFISYPSDIYGLGGRTDPNQGFTINFDGIKFHQTLMRAISNNIYVGIGYYLDNFWNIHSADSLSKSLTRTLNRQLGTRETASGPAFRFVFDSRVNSINSRQGIYASATFRPNYQVLGSNHNNQILQIDARTYFPFPAKSKNTLAFWTFGWFVTGGLAPYLILPSTGWDDNYNTGRGYIQGRFRGKRMYYEETEYRFNITRNGLIGGVAFLNLETFSPDLSATYNNIFPGYGLGLRLKINKHSGTNLCLDYGFGNDASRGFFVNLGEVF